MSVEEEKVWSVKSGVWSYSESRSLHTEATPN